MRRQHGVYLSVVLEVHAPHWLVLHTNLISPSPNQAQAAWKVLRLLFQVCVYMPCTHLTYSATLWPGLCNPDLCSFKAAGGASLEH